MTPPQLYAMPPPADRSATEGTNWQVRVVPNKFPALTVDSAAPSDDAGPYQRIAGKGAHEVVIESPHHDLELADLPVDHVIPVVQTYVLRLDALYQDKGHAYVQLFKNVGREAGASLAHPHAQLVALPLVPEPVQRELQRCMEYRTRQGSSLFETVLRHEIQARERLVELTADFVVLAPFASRFPFELHILPRFAAPNFSCLLEPQQHALARLLHRALGQLKRVLGAFPYNLVLRTCPNPRIYPSEQARRADYRWRLEIIPRMTTMAGMEWGAETFVNPTPPEEAAQRLRQGQPSARG